MARYRHLDTLTKLASLQRLREGEARAHLAAALTSADRATTARLESQRGRQEAEIALDHILSRVDLDPDALRRQGDRMIAADEEVSECLAAETEAQDGVADARRIWHSHRICRDALIEQARRSQAKLMRTRDEKRAMESASSALRRTLR